MKFLVKALSTAVIASASTFAAAEATKELSVSGSVALTSDYRYRGMSQTFNDPALQGGFEVAHASGVYAGVWGSNVDFGGTAHLELDPYIGFATTLEQLPGQPNLDLGLWYYGYPSESDLNWLEAYVSLGFDHVGIKGAHLSTAFNYTNDFLGTDSDAIYLNASYSFPLGTTGFGAVAAVGYTKADANYFATEDTYMDWKAAITYSFASVEGLSAELAAIGTDIDYGAGASHTAQRGVDTGAVFTLSHSF